MHSVFKLYKTFSKYYWGKGALATAIAVEPRPGTMTKYICTLNLIPKLCLKFCFKNLFACHNCSVFARNWFALVDRLSLNKKVFSELVIRLRLLIKEIFKIFILFLKVFASNKLLSMDNITLATVVANQNGL